MECRKLENLENDEVMEENEVINYQEMQGVLYHIMREVEEVDIEDLKEFRFNAHEIDALCKATFYVWNSFTDKQEYAEMNGRKFSPKMQRYIEDLGNAYKKLSGEVDEELEDNWGNR